MYGCVCRCLLLCLISVVLGSATRADFVQIPSAIEGMDACSAAWGDFDNDGDLDLAVCGTRDFGKFGVPVTTIYRNDGKAGFVKIAAELTGVTSGSVAWGDYNNDGYLDLAVCGATSAGTQITLIYRNNGDGTFIDIAAGLLGVQDSSLAWADFDNDGRLDLAVMGRYYNGVWVHSFNVYRNNGQAGFSPIPDSVPGLAYGDMAAADYTGDGCLDLAIAGSNVAGDRVTLLLKNRGDGSFGKGALGVPDLTKCALSWSDFDNDGFIDLAVCGEGADESFYGEVFRNLEGEAFEAIGAGLRGVISGDISWGDFDNDGLPDLLVAGRDGRVNTTTVYRNSGKGRFVDIGYPFLGVEGCAAKWGDFDNDGRLDLVVLGDSDSGPDRLRAASLYLNANDCRPIIPPAPMHLEASLDGDAVTFSWDAGDDARDTSFNLRVGTSPGASDVVCAMSDASTGWRRVPAMGNAQKRLSWTINGLSKRTYYWGVQSVDAAYHGSQWATSVLAYHTVSGRVTVNGQGLSGVNMDVTDGASATTTDAQGVYSIVVPDNWSGKVTPTKTGYDFKPVFRSYSSVSQDMPDQDYTLRDRVISGQVTMTGTGVSAVTITATNGVASVVTNAQGFYSIAVPHGWSGTLTPNRAGFTFVPSSRTYTNLDSDLSGQSFDGTAPAFSVIDAQLQPVSTSSVAWGDFDNDGLPDMAVSGLTVKRDQSTGSAVQTYHTKIYRNTGNGSFTDIGVSIPGLRSGSLAWGDFNNDGRLDLAVSGLTQYSSRLTRIYRNDGNGVFSDIGANLPGVVFSSLAWGDFDNDGRLDLAISGDPGGPWITKVFRNNGDNSFTDIGANLPGVFEGKVAWGDYDNDGYIDLAVCGASWTEGTITKIYRNAKGVFVDSGVSMFGVRDGATLAWGDFNNDGWLDLAVSGAYTVSSLPETRIYRNNGNGTFAAISSQVKGVRYGSLAWGDADNDGDLDLAVSGLSYEMIGQMANYLPVSRLYRNDNGTFVDTGTVITGVTYCSVAWGDFNGDHCLDLAVSGSTHIQPDYIDRSVTQVYANNCLTLNSPPAPPGSLSVTYAGRLPVFAWSAASDLETPVTGLSYNLRIGTTPGGSDVFSGMADSSTGLRRIPAMGSRSILSCSVSGLQPGTAYYWSVQAIDQGYRGSQWASEQATTLHKISGRVARSNGEPMADVTIAANNGGGSTSTDANGYYEILLPQGWSGRLVPSKPTYVFTPARMDYTAIQTSYTDRDFIVVPPLWEPVHFGDIALAEAAIAAVDIDNSGRLDVVVSGNRYTQQGTAAETRVYRNDGNWSFGHLRTYTGVYGGLIRSLDYNNDGLVDIFRSGISSNYYSGLLRNTGTDLVPAHTFRGTLKGFAVGDYDNDGKTDVAVSGDYDGYYFRLYTYRNKGDGNFVIGMEIPGYRDAAMAWGDYDNDGDLDLFVTGNLQGARARLYRNDGQGVFTETDPGIVGLIDGSAAWGDLNNDGRLDLAVTGRDVNSQHITKVYRNDGNGVFTDIAASIIGIVTGTLALGDYDNDGRLDLAICGSEGSHYSSYRVAKIYRNEGNGVFTDTFADIDQLIRDLAWGDVNGDGRLDLLATSHSSTNVSTFKVYRNNNLSANTVPLPPTVLSEVRSGSSVTFSWNAGSDAQTPTDGLTYNIRIGTAPGADDVYSGMALSSGLRKTPAMGNVQMRRSWKIDGLPAGPIYWSVQAIDSAFAGSAWSVERSIVIPEPAPDPVAATKALGDGAAVNTRGAVVTAAFNGFFYIGDEKRSCGIRVTRANHSLTVGQRVKVEGSISTNPDGERHVAATVVEVIGSGSVDPLGLTTKSVGGGDWNYNASTRAGQRGVSGGTGLNNIGLLIRTCGRITRIGAGYLYIDDGAAISDGSSTLGQPNIGVRVICDPAGYMEGDRVIVTGVSSCFQAPGGLARQILVRRPEDIRDISQ